MAIYRRARSTRLLVVSLVMLSLVTITVDYRGGEDGPLSAAGRATLTIVAPLQAAVTKVARPVGRFFSGLANIGSLQSENDALRAEVRKLRRDLAGTNSLQREVARFRTLFALRSSLDLETLAATVIAESPGNLEWSVTIDRGSSDGIRADMPVVSPDGLVGRVAEVASNWCTVQLILDPDSAVAARLVESGETGLLVGQREEDLRMELIDDEAKVSVDEQVVTSGYQGGLYPPNLVIGVVSHVYRQPGSVTKVVAVRPAVDFSALEFVLVVTGPEEALVGPGGEGPDG